MAALVSISALGQSTSAIKDQKAVEIMQTAIGALGGENVWSQIQKSHSEWNAVDSEEPTGQVTQVWDDDWSGQSIVFVHSLIDNKGKYSLSADANHNVENTQPNSSTRLPKELQVIELPLFLPAASFQLLLADPHRKLQYIGLDPNNSSIVRVQTVLLIGPSVPDPYSRQEWKIDLSTGFPSEVDFYTIDIIHHQPVPQSIRFANYVKHGQVEVPSLLNCNRADHPISLSLTSLSLAQ
jgi:hypothetical protein